MTTKQEELLPTGKSKHKTRKIIQIDGLQKYNSHYIWFLNTGHWPDWKNKREVIHHIDGDNQNDDFSNLQLMSNAEHGTLHNIGGGCIIDKMVGKWGPYRYHVKRVGKKQIWTYLGKTSELVRENQVGNSEVAE